MVYARMPPRPIIAGGAAPCHSPSPQSKRERGWRKAETLEAFAKARGHTLLDLAFAWLLARPKVVSVIAGATTPAQVEQNIAAAEWELSPADLAEIDRLTGKAA